MVAGGGDFVTVDLLKPGVVLEGYEGLLKLTGKTRVQSDFLVYNLSVEGVETFFVGDIGSWVHNCDGLIPLYRGVQKEELEDLLRYGDLGMNPHDGGKYFSFFREGAEQFAGATSYHGGDVAIISIRVTPDQLFTGRYVWDPNGGGYSVHFSNDAMIDIYENMPLPVILDAPWIPSLF